MKLFSKLGKAPLSSGAIMGLMGMAATAIVAPAPAEAYVQPIYLGVNQSYYLSTQASIARVAVANPDIADVVVLGTNAVNIVAKKSAGTTIVNVWTKNGLRQEFKVVVSEVNDGLAEQIKQAINLPHVDVRVVKDRVLLTGYVDNQYQKDLAEQIAHLYVGTSAATNQQTQMQSSNSALNDVKTRSRELASNSQIINLLQMMNPEQINIEAMVIEVNSDDAKKLGITYGSPSLASNDGATPDVSVKYGTSSAGSFYAGESYGTMRDKGSHWYNKNWLFTHFSQINAQINALVEQGKARIVSRPNITTMSGSSAAIHIGGQIPYPVVSASSSNVTVEYKDYGIMLKLENPTVDTQGNVTSDLVADVSRLDWTNAVTANGYSMPGLSTRSARTMVNIPSGMTMAIGGLLNSEDSKTIQKVPLLGDIPLLGELFKYHNTTKNKSEIIILITPRVVNETTPVRMSEKLEGIYNDSRRDVAEMKQVDLNGPIPPSKEEVKKQAKEAEKAASATKAEPKAENIVALPEVKAVPAEPAKPAAKKPAAKPAAKAAETRELTIKPVPVDKNAKATATKTSTVKATTAKTTTDTKKVKPTADDKKTGSTPTALW